MRLAIAPEETSTDGDGEAAPVGVLQRTQQLANRFLTRRSKPQSPRQRAVLLGVSVVAFAGLTIVGWRSLPPTPDIRWAPLAIAVVVVVPLTLVVKAGEFRMSARLIGTTVPWREAFEVAVLGAAANLLPIPGSVLVSTKFLSSAGTSRRSAFTATTAMGVVWIGVTGVLAGTALAFASAPLIGIVGMTLGIAVLAAGRAMIARLTGRSRAEDLLRAIALESAFVVCDAVRLLLILSGLGVDASAVQTVAMTAGAALTAATGFLPAGLGLRELLVAGIAPLVDLPASVGLVVAVIDRLQWLLMLALLSSALLLLRRRRGATRTHTGTDG